MQQIGFIGLGAMGDGMAKNLLRAGFAVRGYDVRAEAVHSLVAAGGEGATSPADAARDADILMVVVFTAAQAEEVLFGTDGAVSSLPPGATVAMHATMSPAQSQAMEARLAASGHGFLDAPVTGGKLGADEGTLTVIVSGSPQAIDAARPAFQVVGAKIAVCGAAAGAASTVKMANQMMCGILVTATAEAIALAARAGADPSVVFDVISSGAARSHVWETRVPTILASDFRPRGVVDIFTKDLGIVLDAGKALEFPLPLTAAALQQFLAAAAMGHGRDDDGAVVKVYETLTGVDVAAAAQEA